MKNLLQIPHDDRKILDNLVLQMRTGTNQEMEQANTDLTQILTSYNSRGFDTMVYAAELLKYATTRGDFVLTK